MYSFYMETTLPYRNYFTTHRQARAYGLELLRRNVVEAASHLLGHFSSFDEAKKAFERTVQAMIGTFGPGTPPAVS